MTETTTPEWWQKHYWVSHSTVSGYARCEKCGCHAMGRALSEKCEGQAK